jgi:hypothetical protein
MWHCLPKIGRIRRERQPNATSLRPIAMNAARWRALAALVALAAAGCSGGSSGGDTRASGPRGIRGTELPSFSCGASADGKALRVASAKVVELRVCPVGAPEPFNKPSHPVSLTRASSRFDSLLNALSEPDEPADKTQVCPEYAELLPRMIASTGATALLVHIPSDACGHSLPAARTALSSVIS